jgi:hypothetical protein
LNEEAKRQMELESLRLANEELQSYGSCPECQHASGFLIIGHTMFSFCTEHACYWRVGRSERDYKGDQRAKWIEMGLDDYTQVKGWLLGMRRSDGNS